MVSVQPTVLGRRWCQILDISSCPLCNVGKIPRMDLALRARISQTATPKYMLTTSKPF
jgi:hypothetical protein